MDAAQTRSKSCVVCGNLFHRIANSSDKVWARHRACSQKCGDVIREQSRLAGRLKKSDISEFLARVSPEPNTGCWIWTGPLSTTGYGWFRFNGRRVGAHRFALARFKAEIPEGMGALHTCDNTWCVNPDHLYAGTQSQNIRDSVARGRHWKARSLERIP
jgi:hypothetical protein